MTSTFVPSIVKPATPTVSSSMSHFTCQALPGREREEGRLCGSNLAKDKTQNRRSKLIECNAEETKIPESPDALVQSWKQNRSIASTIDLSRRFVSVLLLSNRCERACVAEKVLIKCAEKYAVSRRLLILSAGIDSQPGDMLPLTLVSKARDVNIDLTDERPCAAFMVEDLEHYDFIVVVDRNVRDRLLRMAEISAHKSGGHLSDWERKIRLLCDFDGSSNIASSTASRGLQPLDISPFESSPSFSNAMEVIRHSCEHLVRTLLAAGL